MPHLITVTNHMIEAHHYLGRIERTVLINVGVGASRRERWAESESHALPLPA